MIWFTVISALVLCFLMGIYNGLFIRSNEVQDKVKAYKRWHFFGGVIRFAILLLWIPLYGLLGLLSWAFFLTLYLFIGWVIYDATINLMRPNITGSFIYRFFYSGSASSGTTSKIDLMLGRWLPMLKLVYTALMVFFTAYYIFSLWN